MVGEAWNVEEGSGAVDGVLAFADGHDGFAAGLAGKQSLQHVSAFGNHRDTANFPVFGSSDFIATYGDLATLEINIIPRHADGLRQTATRISKEAHEVGTLLGVATARSFHDFQELVKLLAAEQGWDFASHTHTLDVSGGIVVTCTGFDRHFENMSHSRERAVESRCRVLLGKIACPFFAILICNFAGINLSLRPLAQEYLDKILLSAPRGLANLGNIQTRAWSGACQQNNRVVHIVFRPGLEVGVGFVLLSVLKDRLGKRQVARRGFFTTARRLAISC